MLKWKLTHYKVLQLVPLIDSYSTHWPSSAPSHIVAVVPRAAVTSALSSPSETLASETYPSSDRSVLSVCSSDAMLLSLGRKRVKKLLVRLKIWFILVYAMFFSADLLNNLLDFFDPGTASTQVMTAVHAGMAALNAMIGSSSSRNKHK